MSFKDIRAIYSIWLRDLTRYRRDRFRLVSSVAQPALYLFVFGTGLSRGLAIRGGSGSSLGPVDNYVVFIYPGILGMSLLFTSIFSAMSIIWDREFGFLKEVMVAPISRTSVAIGKAMGGSTVAVIQGLIILLFAPFIGVSLSIQTLVIIIPLMFLISFSLTSFGIVIAARMESMEGFQMVMNFLVMPLFLLSGAMFPIERLPEWLKALTVLDPLTYGVDALRGLMLGMEVSANPISLNIAVIIAFGAAMISLAVVMFNRKE